MTLGPSNGCHRNLHTEPARPESCTGFLESVRGAEWVEGAVITGLECVESGERGEIKREGVCMCVGG